MDMRFSNAKETGRRLALVIGNGAYTHADPLKNPARDAEELARKLQALGFDVTKGIDLKDRDVLLQLFEAFYNELTEKDTVLFYYSGHGLQINDANYLVPTSAKVDDFRRVDEELVGFGWLLERLTGKAGRCLLFLDACRDNPFSKRVKKSVQASKSLGGIETDVEGREVIARSGLAQVGQSEINTDADTFIAFAAAPGAVAYDGTGDTSPFTTALLRHLPTNGLDIAAMMIRIRNDVLSSTDNDQQPWDRSFLREAFYFKPVEYGSAFRSIFVPCALVILLVAFGYYYLIDWVPNGPESSNMHPELNAKIISYLSISSPMEIPILTMDSDYNSSLQSFFLSPIFDTKQIAGAALFYLLFIFSFTLGPVMGWKLANLSDRSRNTNQIKKILHTANVTFGIFITLYLIQCFLSHFLGELAEMQMDKSSNIFQDQVFDYVKKLNAISVDLSGVVSEITDEKSELLEAANKEIDTIELKLWSMEFSFYHTTMIQTVISLIVSLSIFSPALIYNAMVGKKVFNRQKGSFFMLFMSILVPSIASMYLFVEVRPIQYGTNIFKPCSEAVSEQDKVYCNFVQRRQGQKNTGLYFPIRNIEKDEVIRHQFSVSLNSYIVIFTTWLLSFAAIIAYLIAIYTPSAETTAGTYINWRTRLYRRYFE